MVKNNKAPGTDVKNSGRTSAGEVTGTDLVNLLKTLPNAPQDYLKAVEQGIEQLNVSESAD